MAQPENDPMCSPDKRLPAGRFGGGLVLLASIAACSGAGLPGGCGALEPLPNFARYGGPKADDPISVRLSSHGIDYLNSQWPTFLGTFTGDGGTTLHLPMSCQIVDVPVIGKIAMFDQGSCDSESCGRMDGKCDSQDKSADVAVEITDFRLVPTPSDTMEAVLDVSIDTEEILVDTLDRSHAACAFLSPVKCSVDFWTPRKNPPVNEVRARVRFSIDQKWDHLLAFEIGEINGTKVCGTGGSGTLPGCLDPDDVDISRKNNCGMYCSIADWGWVKDFLLKRISPMLQDRVRDAIRDVSCATCGPGQPACPVVGGAVSVCEADAGICLDSDTGACLPRFLGVEGRLSASTFLGSFGVPAASKLDLSIAAGGSVSVDTGLNMGTRAGLGAVSNADCVPFAPAVPLQSVPAPDFDGEAPAGSSYHVGLGISKPFIDRALHEAHQSGMLCLNITHAAFGLLNTGTFKLFLPSLDKLASRDGKDAPMMVALRPKEAPTADIGLGTVDPATQQPKDPLMTLTMNRVDIDLYALVDERWARLFTISGDVSLPASLVFDGCSKMTPVIGDLKNAIHLTVGPSEILGDDTAVLGDFLQAVMGFAAQPLAQALKPFSLPDVGQFKLKIETAKGLSKIPGSDRYNFLGIYAGLLPPGGTCTSSSAMTSARLISASRPANLHSRKPGEHFELPVALLEVGAGGEGSPAAEFSYRVDRGFWSSFGRASVKGEIAVSHPVLLLQGNHLIEVRSRIGGLGGAISEPAPVVVRSDWEAPEILLAVDRVKETLEISGRDKVTASADLEYSVRWGKRSTWESLGAERALALGRIEEAGGVEISARDQSGNVAQRSYRVAASRADEDPRITAGEQTVGCSALGGSGVPVLGLALLLALRTRRRNRH